ncbi:MAG: glycosyltransferase [Bacteroidota bacterium]
MELIIVIAYILSLLFIFMFSVAQLHLTWHYLRSLREKSRPPKTIVDWPKVTVQLPIYNERYVVERLIDAICAFDYPADQLEIQILDDSTDETVEIIAKKVADYQTKGINIQQVRRADRSGFKAGALAYGLEIAEGEYIAIFDADFLPAPDFLKRTLPHFTHKQVGVVQTRWGHINQDYSLLTRLQAFGLDGHFTIEQGGRKHAGSFINFNGTGGVWRKECITDAGGWSDDTLTEDLDLSYRAQAKGWEFVYREDVEAPAELPILMPAIKSQQFRWNKGAAECARKHASRLAYQRVARPFRWVNRLHAFFHLFNSSVFLSLLLAALLSVPMLFIKDAYPQYQWIFNLGGIFIIGFFSIGLFYWISTRRLHAKQPWRYYVVHYPLFLIITMGLSLHNAIAVAEGLLGFKSPFLRTPKFNVTNAKEKWSSNVYIKGKLSPMVLLEAALALYFAYGIYTGIRLGDFGLLLFHGMLATGFAAVAYYSFRQVRHA